MRRACLMLSVLLASVGSSAVVTLQVNNFNSGELSTLLEGRSDLAKYSAGCRTLENMFVLPAGAAERRPGTLYVAAVKDASDGAVRLIPYVESVTDAYILELGDQYMRIYHDGEQVLDGASAYEVATPWAIGDLFELHTVQDAQTMYVAHPDYLPYTITRTSDTDWTVAAIPHSKGPFRDENTTDTTIRTTGTTGTVTLIADANLWTADYVGSLWKIRHPRQDNTITSNEADGNLDQVGETTDWLSVEKTWRVQTNLTWNGSIVLDRSYDGGTTYHTIKGWASHNDNAVDDEGDETEPNAVYRLRMIEWNANDCKAWLSTDDYWYDGIVRITEYIDANDVNAVVIEDLGDVNETKLWNEGSWNAVNGYPATCALYQQRLWFAGTAAQPQTVWGSKQFQPHYLDFRGGTDDDDSVSFTMASDRVNAIRWMTSRDSLLLGTSGAEWKMTSSSTDTSITPTNISIRRQSTYGSSTVQAQLVGQAVLFVQRQGLKLRQMEYSFERDSYVAPDLTLLSDHILESGVTQMDYQQQPWPLVWLIRADGTLAVLTYDSGADVFAWSRLVTDGQFESVAVIPGATEDEIWVSVSRTVNGATVRYIERFSARDWGTDDTDVYFVDSGINYDGGAAKTLTAIDVNSVNGRITGTSAAHGISDGCQVRIRSVAGMTELNGNVYTTADSDANSFVLKNAAGTAYIDGNDFTHYTSGGTATVVENTITGLAHLEGESLTACVDGAIHGAVTVSGGSVTLDDYYNTVHVGLAFTSTLRPMQLVWSNDFGSNAADIKRIVSVLCKFYRTGGAKLGPSTTVYDTLPWRRTSDPLDAATPLFTGDKLVRFAGGYSLSADIVIQQDQPLPMTVLSLSPQVEVSR